jgi:hypothetical protein
MHASRKPASPSSRRSAASFTSRSASMPAVVAIWASCASCSGVKCTSIASDYGKTRSEARRKFRVMESTSSVDSRKGCGPGSLWISFTEQRENRLLSFGWRQSSDFRRSDETYVWGSWTGADAMLRQDWYSQTTPILIRVHSWPNFLLAKVFDFGNGLTVS